MCCDPDLNHSLKEGRLKVIDINYTAHLDTKEGLKVMIMHPLLRDNTMIYLKPGYSINKIFYNLISSFKAINALTGKT